MEEIYTGNEEGSVGMHRKVNKRVLTSENTHVEKNRFHEEN